MDANTPPYVPLVYKLMDRFSQQMKREYGLQLYGTSGGMPRDVEMIGLMFLCKRHASMEEARILEVEVTEKFLHAINEDEALRPYLHTVPFPREAAHITISFVKKNNAPYTDGSVSVVFQVKNTIFYNARAADEISLIDLHSEPYEEALKIVQVGCGEGA